MATAQFPDIEEAYTPLQKAVEQTTKQVEETAQALYANGIGTPIEERPTKEKKSSIFDTSCETEQFLAMFGWAPSQIAHRNKLELINTAIGKAFTPFTTALAIFAQTVGTNHKWYDIRADTVEELYNATHNWDAILEKHNLQIVGTNGRQIKTPHSTHVDQALQLYSRGDEAYPKTPIIEALAQQGYHMSESSSVGWWQHDASRPLGFTLPEHWYTRYAFSRRNEGFWPFLIRRNGGFAGEYHYREGMEEVKLWRWCNDLGDGLKDFIRSTKTAARFNEVGIPYETVYHTRYEANVSKEKFFSEVQRRHRIQTQRNAASHRKLEKVVAHLM